MTTLALQPYTRRLAVDGEPREWPEAARLDAPPAAWRAADTLLLVVPEVLERSELARLLGEARAAGLAPAAFIGEAALDGAHAAGTLGGEWAAAPAMLRLDLGDNGSRLGLLQPAAGGWRLRRTLDIALGASEPEQAVLQLAARVIVRATRFDPLHDARVEAALRVALDSMWPAIQARGVAEARLELGGRELAFALTRDQLREALAAPLQGLLAGLVALQAPARCALLAPARLLDLPGAGELLAQAGATPLATLVPGGTVAAASRLKAQPPAEDAGIPLITRFPAEATGAAAACAPRAFALAPLAARTAPTHLVLDGRAHRIDAAGLVLGRAPGDARGLALPAGLAGVSRRHCTLRLEGADAVLTDHSRHGSYIDGRRVAGRARVHVGERLRIGTPGIELALVLVQEGG
jgi:hypothetical protein